MLTNGTAISVSVFERLPFDPLKDFAPVSSLGFFDFIFCTSVFSGFTTLGDFIAAAKAKPGALNVGTINVGSTQNLSAELFKTAANIDFTIVPYRGTPEVEVSLLQGNIALMIDSYSAIKGNIAEGKFRALASSGPCARKVRLISQPCRKAGSIIMTSSPGTRCSRRRAPSRKS